MVTQAENGSFVPIVITPEEEISKTRDTVINKMAGFVARNRLAQMKSIKQDTNWFGHYSTKRKFGKN